MKGKNMLYELPEKVNKEVKTKYLNDNLVLFAGAGLSMPFHIGSWKELIENMVSEYYGAAGSSAIIRFPCFSYILI